MATCASPASSKLTSLLSVEFARFGDRLYLREVLNPFKSLWSRASFSSNCAVSSMVLVIFLAKQEVRSFSGTFAVSFTVYTRLRVLLPCGVVDLCNFSTLFFDMVVFLCIVELYCTNESGWCSLALYTSRACRTSSFVLTMNDWFVFSLRNRLFLDFLLELTQ